MRLLVTGGAGFIGSNFVRNASLGKYQEISEITVLDKLTYAGSLVNLVGLGSNIKYNFVQGDICDSALVRSLISHSDAIINFAAESHVDRSIENSTDFINTNILGVQVLLEAIREISPGKRFVQISTDEVYGSITVGSWDEYHPLKPRSPYSASKASADLISQAFANTYKLDVVITRCSNNYGPRQHNEKLIPFFINRIIQNKYVPLYGDGKNIRDWLHVSDHCNAIFLALTKGRSGEIYNIGGGQELSNIEITKVLLACLGKSEELIKFVPDRPGHDFRYSVNYEKAYRELGYEPTNKFEESILETIDWYRKSIES